MADISITAANVVIVSGSASTGTAGETITAGQALYLNSTDNELYKADANDTAAKAVVVGVALNGASNGQPLSYAPAGCVVNMGATLTVGTIYVLSTTAGGVAPSTDLATSSYVTVLGVAQTAANLKLTTIISGVQVPA